MAKNEPPIVIRPAGMSYARAFEIALAVSEKSAEPKHGPDIEEKVRVLHGEGVNDATIAKLLHLPPSTTSAIRSRLGLQPHVSKGGPRKSIEVLDRKARLREFAGKGHTDREIAALMQLDRRWVQRTRMRLGIPVNPENKTTNAA